MYFFIILNSLVHPVAKHIVKIRQNGLDQLDQLLCLERVFILEICDKPGKKHTA